MGVASQAYLDATRAGIYTTPEEWNTLASAWEASVFSAQDTALWIDAGLMNPNIAATASADLITPEDFSRIAAWINDRGLPAYTDARGAVALMRAVYGAGGVRNLTPEKQLAILTQFFDELSGFGLGFGNV